MAGRLFPRELLPRNVGQLAESLPLGARDPGLRRLLERIDQAPIFPGNRVELFFSGRAAFTAMTAAIARAEREVLLQSYILKDDEVGEELARVLVAAVERGVQVRLLADAFGSSATKKIYWWRLRRAGVQVRLVNNLFPALWYGKTFRDHRKILVIDRRVAFTGGMNVGDEYLRSDHARGSWRDTHALVEGGAAWEMAVVFAEGWAWAGGGPLGIDSLAIDERLPGQTDAMVLDSRPLRGHVETASAMAATIGAARHAVSITNAYFAPRRGTIEILTRAAARGVDVRLLLPGITDVPLVRHAGHGYFATLLEQGVRIFEYQPAVLHAKTMVVDRHVAMVGSTNIDFRSFHLNAECNLLLLDDVVAGTLQDRFELDLADAVEITPGAWRKRSRWHRYGDALAKSLAWAL